MRRGSRFEMGAGRYSAQPLTAQYAAWPSLIGAEMTVNGDCSSATGWDDQGNPPGAVVVALGVMTATISQMSERNSGTGAASLVEGGTYRCGFSIGTVSVPASGVKQLIGLGEGLTRSTAGTYSDDIIASDIENEGGWSLNAVSGAVTMTFDNFSVKSVGLLGVEADWTFTGDVLWNEGVVEFDGATFGDKAELTGAAKTAFDAAVSNNTACTVTIYASASNPLDGSIRVILKGGTFVTFSFSATPNESVTHTVTSGSGSGPEFIAGGDSPAGQVARVVIVPA